MTIIEKRPKFGTRVHPVSIALLALLLGSTVPLADASAAVLRPTAATPATQPNAKAVSVAPQSPEVVKLLKEADEAIKANNLNLALVQLRSAVGLAPKDGRIRARLGIALLNSGDAATAERELRQAWADGATNQVIVPPLLDAMMMRGKAKDLLDEFHDPAPGTRDTPTADILRARARAFQALGQTDNANASMERSLAIRRDAPSLLARAQIAVQQNDLKLAITYIDEAIKVDPHGAVAIRFKIEVLRRSGDTQGALNLANDLVKKVPKSELAKISRIRVLLDLNSDAEAKQDVDDVLKQTPKSLVGLYYRAVLLTRAKDYKDAWHIALVLPAQFTQSQPDIAIAVAQMAISADNVDTGIAILSAFLAQHPETTLARLRLGALRLQKDGADAALSVLEPIKNADDPQAQVLLAQAYLKLNRNADAIGALENTGVAGNGNPLLKRQPALSGLQTDDSDDAIQGLRQVVDNDPSKAENVAPLVAILSRAGKLDEALAVADRMANATNNKNALPRFLRGQILMLKNDLPGALAAFDQSLALDPKYVPALYFRAGIALSRGDSARASADLKAIVAQEPKNVPAYVKLADMLSKSVEAQLLLAAAYDANHDLNNGSAALKRAIGLDPVSVPARSLLIDMLADNGQTKDALAMAQDYAKANPGPASDILTADTLVKLKRNDEAIALLIKSLASKPDVRLVLRLQQLETANGDLKKAIALLADWLAKNPNDIDIRRQYASVLQESGDVTHAKMEYETVLARRPADLVTLTNLGYLLQKDDPQRALQLLTLAVKIAPQSAETVDALGWMKFQGSEKQGALELLERAYGLDRNNPEIGYHYAAALDAAGKRAQAKPVLQSALLQVALDSNRAFTGLENAKQLMAKW